MTFIYRQKLNFILHVFFEILQRYCKFIVLGTLGMPGYTHPKWYYQFVVNFPIYLLAKKSTASPMLFWRYCKDMQTSYFGCFGYAWLHKLKSISSTYSCPRCLSAFQKWTSSLTSLMRYYILKSSAIWLADRILPHNSRTRIFPDMGLVMKL